MSLLVDGENESGGGGVVVSYAVVAEAGGRCCCCWQGWPAAVAALPAFAAGAWELLAAAVAL